MCKLAPEGAKLHADGECKGGTMMKNSHDSDHCFISNTRGEKESWEKATLSSKMCIFTKGNRFIFFG